jgi:predicted O-methyltransferase YrrM
MAQDQWTAVDNYINDRLLPPDPVMDSVLQASQAAGLEPINVAPNQGKFLHLLARIQGARNILEIGTLGGYSTIWLARALPPGGRLVTLELNPKNAEVALANIAHAGFAHCVELKLGPAAESLAQLSAEGRGPFDLIFIDADKQSYPVYLSWALKLSRVGSQIIVDNVVRRGEVVNVSSTDPRIPGTRGVYDFFAKEPRISATAIQTVGIKGYDGFAIGLVIA